MIRISKRQLLFFKIWSYLLILCRWTGTGLTHIFTTLSWITKESFNTFLTMQSCSVVLTSFSFIFDIAIFRIEMAVISAMPLRNWCTRTSKNPWFRLHSNTFSGQGVTVVCMTITVARFTNNTKLIFLALVVSQITIFTRKPSVTGITFTFFNTVIKSIGISFTNFESGHNFAKTNRKWGPLRTNSAQKKGGKKGRAFLYEYWILM